MESKKENSFTLGVIVNAVCGLEKTASGLTETANAAV